MVSMGEAELESLKNLCKMITKELTPFGMQTLSSLIDNFRDNIISHSEFSNSIHSLFKNHRKTKLEEGEFRQHHVLSIRVNVDERSLKEKEYPIHHGGVRVKVEQNPKEDVLKRPKKSMLLSYRLIPEEEQCPVKHEALNNKCSLLKFEEFEHRQPNEYEESMARCEEEMRTADVRIESLRSAVEKAENVLNGEMKVKELGVMFYKSINKICPGDMSERVKKDYKKALNEILPRLKQELDKVTSARERRKPRLKKKLEENTAKQRESTAQGQGRKQCTFVSDFIYPLHKTPK